MQCTTLILAHNKFKEMRILGKKKRMLSDFTNIGVFQATSHTNTITRFIYEWIKFQQVIFRMHKPVVRKILKFSRKMKFLNLMHKNSVFLTSDASKCKDVGEGFLVTFGRIFEINLSIQAKTLINRV